MYYDRKTKNFVDETEYQKELLHFLYNTACGRFLLKIIIARPWFSKVRGIYQKSSLSRKNIVPFINKYHVDIDGDYASKHYKNFNDFFIRHKNINIAPDANVLISPADSKMQIFDITDELILQIKQSKYCVEDLIQDKDIAQFYAGGKCLVFRLAVDDYHRYHFIDDGKIVSKKKIKGELHTVRPIAERYNIFTRNAREVTVLDTINLGRIVYIEVGALLVGKINNHNKTTFQKHEEKGYFEFGGSTIVVLINKNVEFDSDILKANSQGYETKVFAGEKIGLIKE